MSSTETSRATTGPQRTKLIRPSKYTAVLGYFKQTDPGYNEKEHDILNESFGLKDTSEGNWSRFTQTIDDLNDKADSGEVYKVLFIGRHGEGYHNRAETFYGSDDWNSRYAKEHSNDSMTWGPDPILTEVGEEQAKRANTTWKREIGRDMPLVQSHYTSPLRRAADTCKLTFEGILPSDGSVVPQIRENLRERVGPHTCDQRSKRSQLEELYKGWKFKDSFTEEDEIWGRPPFDKDQETDEAAAKRTGREIDDIFSTDDGSVISITSHGGAIRGMLTTLGHQFVDLQTGGVIAMLIKAEGSEMESTAQ